MTIVIYIIPLNSARHTTTVKVEFLEENALKGLNVFSPNRERINCTVHTAISSKNCFLL